MLVRPMTETRIIATINAKNGYDGLQAALKARSDEKGLTRSKLDELSGMAEGWSGKVLGAAQIHQFGMAGIAAMCFALGLCFELREDPEQEELMRPHWERGETRQARPNRLPRLGKTAINRFLPEVAREMGRRGGSRPMPAHALKHASKRASKGGKARKRNMTRLQRQQAARKAAVARWAKRNAHRDILIVTGDQE